MPMTHLPEIGAKNRYRFLTRLTCNLVPNFSGISKVTNRTCSAFVPVYGTSFLVHGFSAPISGKYVMGIFLTVVGRKVLSHFSFIVTRCRYLINCMKDSCCFIDDYCCSDNIVLRTVAGLPIRFEMLGILQLTMMLMTYITQLKRSRMPCMLLSFVNNIRF